jgi:lysozyme
LFNNDIQIAIDDVRKIVNRFDDLPEQAKIVLIDLSFNLGMSKLLKFENFLDAIDARNFAKAGEELKDSRWWHQVGTRATRNYELLQECITD